MASAAFPIGECQPRMEIGNVLAIAHCSTAVAFQEQHGLRFEPPAQNCSQYRHQSPSLSSSSPCTSKAPLERRPGRPRSLVRRHAFVGPHAEVGARSKTLLAGLGWRFASLRT